MSTGTFLQHLPMGKVPSIEFDAFVISVGTNVNLVNITGSKDSGLPLYCQDTATVIVGECPTPSTSLTCEKKVWNPTTQQWVESNQREHRKYSAVQSNNDLQRIRHPYEH